MIDIRNPISWHQQKRFEYIEWQLLWLRRLNAKPLMDHFGISRHQATKDVQSYLELAPNNLAPYDPKLKYYAPSEGFRPVFATESPADFILEKGFAGQYAAPFVEKIPALTRRVPAGLLPIVMESIGTGCALDLKYASARSPTGETRRLWPRAIVYATNRLHIRAYCGERQEFRDFNISRILDLPRKVYVALPRSTDVAWELMLQLHLVPNRFLTQEGQSLISKEFGFVNGKGSVQIRAALLNYYLQDNLIPYSSEQLLEAQSEPWKYPALIENLDNLKEWCFS